jgi:hypothetical protein
MDPTFSSTRSFCAVKSLSSMCFGSGDRKYEVDVDWLTGRVAILD